MRKLFAALVLLPLLALPGCQALSTVATIATIDARNPVTLTQVYQLRLTYGAALAGAKAYASLPFCQPAPPPCAERRIVIALDRADRAAEGALDKVEAFVRKNPRLNAGSLFAGAQTAIAEFGRVKALYSVR